MKTIRCAIYTRKSSEEGLDQAFNSLDAQREACAAYILSQASEGWVALPDIYDDGGLSGGTLERPALQRLLTDLQGGRVDIIVVYKVDRLTRSLFDFAKLVEILDNASTSFVSVTQSFNTTTSMGRLTLNMLLSFAQFEREVTAERIRDKIAASKAKGMWMGGTPPLGYRPDGRSLAIVEDQPALVRDMFERYLKLGNVRHVAEALKREGIISPVRHTITGKSFGGGAFSRGQLYAILRCPTYVGEIAHRGATFPGKHEAIIDRETWDKAQALLSEHIRGSRTRSRAECPALLAGKLFDAKGEPLISAHACKGKVRYRYYVSRALQHGTDSGMRIPAREIEAAVAERIAQALDDPLELAGSGWLVLPGVELGRFHAKCSELAASVRRRDREALPRLIENVTVADGRIEIRCRTDAIAASLGVEREQAAPASLVLISDVRLTRSGRAMRLVHGNGASTAPRPDRSVVRLIIRARGWWAELRKGNLDVSTLAAREGVTASYLTRVLRLAFLAPEVVDAMMAGVQRHGVDCAMLVSAGGVPIGWTDQARALLADGHVRRGT
jgi:site-specific DNA recombinase